MFAIAARQAGLQVAALDTALDHARVFDRQTIELRDLTMANNAKATLQQSRNAKMLMFVGWHHVRPDRQGLIQNARRIGLRVRTIAVAGEIDPAHVGSEMGFNRSRIESFMVDRGLGDKPSLLGRSLWRNIPVPRGCDALLRVPRYAINLQRALTLFGSIAARGHDVDSVSRDILRSATVGELLLGAAIAESRGVHMLGRACLLEAVTRGDRAALLDLASNYATALRPAQEDRVRPSEARSVAYVLSKEAIEAAISVGAPGGEQTLEALDAIASGVISPVRESLGPTIDTLR